MKRIAIKLVVFLLLGAAVNVGVAWGCARYSAVRESLPPLDQSEESVLWGRFAPSGGGWWLPQTSDVNARWKGLGVTETKIGDFHLVNGRFVLPGNGRHRMLTVRDVGIPVRCHREARRFNALELLVQAARPPSHTPWQARLQTRLDAVLWPGFAINSVFYGVILWLLWSAPFTTRRLIRKQRGRCIKCGYDLRHAEHEVCPECGGRGWVLE